MTERPPQCLRELIPGIQLEDFFSRVWGKEPRTFTGSSDRFLGLCSVAALPAILAKFGPRMTNVYAMRDGKADESVWAKLAFGLHRNEPLDAQGLCEICRGATLVVNETTSRHAPLAELARMLFAELGEPVGINAYLSPGGGDLGLGYHYDCWDVFVLQVEGEKRWQLFDTPAPYPIDKMEMRQARVPTTEAARDLVLHAGQVLYMPRGTWHRPQPTQERSLHLTVGVHCKRPLDLADWIVQVLKRDPELRRDLPLTRDGRNETLQVQALERAMAQMRELLSRPDAARRFLRNRFEVETFRMFPDPGLRPADPLTQPAYDPEKS